MIVSLLRSILLIGKPTQLSVAQTNIQEDFKSFLSSRGIKLLSPLQLQQISLDFTDHLHAGFTGRHLSLAGVPSLLSAAILTEKDCGKKSLVIEMGGTNCSAALVTIAIQKDKIIPVITTSETKAYIADDKQFASAHDFFVEVAEVARSVVGNSPIDAVGVIWSFPGRVEQTAKGVDQRAIYMDKGFVIPGIEDSLIGEALMAVLQEKHLQVNPSASIAVLNDTVAVLLAGGGKIGGVIGTGFNLAAEHEGQIYNLEAGGFSEVPQTQLTQAIDTMDNPGVHLAEKQISGKYIGMQMDTITTWLSEEGFLSGVERIGGQRLQASHVSALLSGNREKIAEVLSGITDESFGLLQEVAEVLRGRSAQIAGTMIGALVKEIGKETLGDIVIPIEGSFYAKTPGYQEVVEQAAREALAENLAVKHVVFKEVKQSGIKGAAVAAITVKE